MKKLSRIFILTLIASVPVAALSQHQENRSLEAKEITHNQSLHQVTTAWTDQNNQTVRLPDFSGESLLIVMFYGECAGTCPFLIKNTWDLYNSIDPEIQKSVNVLAVSFDYRRDSPATLKQYASHEQLDIPKWHFVTAGHSNIRELAMLLGVQYRQRSDGHFEHTNLITVLDREGKIAARVDGISREPAEAINIIENMHALPTVPEAADTLTVEILGTHADSRFEPDSADLSPGSVIRFEVKEGLHTVTAYHPDNRRPLGIPETAESFDSGILEKGDIWYLTLDVEGEYNYFCLPHERMGHTGKINVVSERPSVSHFREKMDRNQVNGSLLNLIRAD